MLGGMGVDKDCVDVVVERLISLIPANSCHCWLDRRQKQSLAVEMLWGKRTSMISSRAPVSSTVIELHTRNASDCCQM